VTFPERTFSRVSIEVLADSAGDLPRWVGQSPIGFTEVELGGEPNPADPDLEAVRLPTDLLAAAGAEALDHPLAVTLTRQRQDPTDPARADEERSLVRAFDLPGPRQFSLAGTARLSPWADPALTGELIGRPRDGSSAWADSSDRPTGALISSAPLIFDGDPATAWHTDGSYLEGQWVEVNTPRPVTIDSLPLSIVADGLHSRPTEVTLSVDGEEVATVDVPALDDRGPAGHTDTVELDVPRVRGRSFRLELSEVEIPELPGAVYGDAPPPVAIAEVDLPGPKVPELSRRVDSGCRDDLLTVNDRPVPVRVRGTTADALAARPLRLAPCGDRRTVTLRTENLLSSTRGSTSGIDVDQLVLRSAAGGAASSAEGTLVAEAGGTTGTTGATGATETSDDRAGVGPARSPGQPRVEVVSESAAHVRVRVSGATPGTPFWLVLGQSYNDGWTATPDGGEAVRPELVDGFANGWRLDPDAGTFEVDLAFTPQRTVDAALWLSLLAGLLCVGLALRKPRPVSATATGPEVPGTFAPAEAFRYLGTRPAPVVAVAVVVGMAALGWALAGPAVGAITGLAAAAGTRSERARPLVLAGSAAALALAALYVVGIQLLHHPEPGLDWPSEMRKAHPLGWLSVLLLTADVVVARAWRRHPHHHRP
jgi:hypothetical protein